MNALAQHYHDHSQPAYCAQYGLVDEIVKLQDLRSYLQAFAGAAYQNPQSICPRHHLLLPRMIKG
jgi:glutaconyl-CoA decarboxylase